MLAWILRRARAVRNWLFVRLRIWRGRWRRGRVRAPGARWLPGPLVPRTWRYGLYAPGGMRDDQSAPLVVVLHGCKQHALSFAYAAGWMDFADSARVRLLCPRQRRLANFHRCWNWFHPSAQSGQGELAVVTAMIDDVATRVRVDDNAVAVIGLSAGGALAALLAFHDPRRFRAVVTVAAAPLLGRFSAQNPHGVMQRGVALNPILALGARHDACAPLAIIHGSADDVVHPRCAEQLLAQAVESFRRMGRSAVPGATLAGAAGASVTDFRADGELLLRRIDVQGMGHAWTGGPGGHPYCERAGAPLTALCAQFLRDVGVLTR
jgi:poly(hydroxyalkanoate) depolymerase family esterase